MGRRGPRPAPTALKLAKGERRPSRVNYEEPQLPAVQAAALAPPTGLEGAGLAEWQRVAPLLSTAGVLKDTDLVALEDYCRTLTELRRFEGKARKAGPELSIAKGYAGMAIKLRAQANTLRRELGLTPSSRAGVKGSQPQEEKDAKVARYLNAIPGRLHAVPGGRK